MKKTHRKIKAKKVKKISTIPNGSLNCDLCSKSFRDRSSFNSHNYYVHPKVEYKCHLCEKSFKRNFYLKLHLKTHDINQKQLNIFECKVCNKQFKTGKF